MSGNLTGNVVGNVTGDVTGDVTGNINNSTLLLKTGGNERLRITSTGDVGLGCIPDSNVRLHIEKAGEANMILEGDVNGIGGYLMLKNNNTTANASMAIQFLDAGGQGTSEIKGINSDNSSNEGHLAFSTRPSGGSMTERMRITKEGYVTKPNNPAFRARASSGGWKSFGNTSFNTMPFNAEDFDSGGNYNTSTYKFTVPVAGRYYFYCQMQHDGTTGNGGNSGRMRIYVSTDIVAYGKSGTQGETVSCGTVWDCIVGEEVYCQGATPNTNGDDWHGDSYYSFFTGYLIG